MSISFRSISGWVEVCHALAVEKGWYEGEEPPLAQRLLLMISELVEAFEEHRNGQTVVGVYYKDGKPEGIPIELADCVIRIFDFCGRHGIDLEWAIRTKHEYNKTRPHRHGGKKA